MTTDKNIFGESLSLCSGDPLTGFTRSGCCESPSEDVGSHTVCVEITREFLEFSRSVGNDLSTPVPEFGFAGLLPGDRWCLCAARWQQAFEAGYAPRVILSATHQRCLDVIDIADLKSYALDLV